MEHLVIIPHDGVGNRVRAIACARRFCAFEHARCTIVWDWGNFADMFESASDFDVLVPSESDFAGYERIVHLRSTDGGTFDNRTQSLFGKRCVVLRTAWLFGTASDIDGVAEADLRPWLPRPAPMIQDRVARLGDYLGVNLMDLVGVHIRQGDNAKAKELSPLAVFEHLISETFRSGSKVYLATDDLAVQTTFLEKFRPENIFTSPKTWSTPLRWPLESTSVGPIVDDIVDLFALVSCRYIMGSAASSFSRLAMVYNGSAHNFPLWVDQGGRLRRMNLGIRSKVNR